MGFSADIIVSMATSVVRAAGGILCSPLCDRIKAYVDVLNAPESFSEDVKKLSDLMEDIKAMNHSDYIDKWLSEAEKIIEGIPLVLLDQERSISQNHVLCCISSLGVSRCMLHKKVRKLKIQGQNIITCVNLNIQPIEHIHGVPIIENGSTAERNLKQVMDMLNNDEVWSIGVWGPGGVGKTTLLNVLNNKLENTSSFSLVRLITLTKDANESQVQKAIAESLNLTVEKGMNTKRIAEWIHNRLQREKFLLILDNVWESINLGSLGIPENQKRSKVVLTTRLENVCIGMKAKAIKMKCLTTADAWQLFVEKAGDVVNNVRIRPLAEAVCEECGGLPLALVVVGSSMREKNNVHLWRSAVNDLRSSNFPDGVESQIYKSLKLSFDFLANDTLESCFLYCSLFPQGYGIRKSELVQCWLAENIIDNQLNIESAYSKGLDLIEKLKSSCLLEDYCVDYVKMHDIVRDVAIRIGKLKGTSVVLTGHGIYKNSRVALPEEVENIEWISFLENENIVLPEYKKDFPKATTLFLHNNSWHEPVQVSEEFLKGFQALRVLIMSNHHLFSCSLQHLTELRALILQNFDGPFEQVSCGTKLMVLNLSCCLFSRLPKGIEKQTNLRELNLSFTDNLKSIEADIIRNLSSLEILDTRDSGYRWHTKRRSRSKEVTLQDLSRLKSLKEIYLNLADVEATYIECSWMETLKRFLLCYGSFNRKFEDKVISIEGAEGNKVGSFILHAKTLRLVGMNVEEIFSCFNTTDQANSKLRSLAMVNCLFSKELMEPIPSLKPLVLDTMHNFEAFSQIANKCGTIFNKLVSLYIYQNPKLENVFSSSHHHLVLPELEEMTIGYCRNLTVLHDGPLETQAFVPKLKRLTLHGLESLQSLCNCNLSEQFQSVVVLRVYGCHNLKKLPHMASIKEIKGEEIWWNNLEWEDQEIKSSMNQFFKLWDTSDDM